MRFTLFALCLAIGLPACGNDDDTIDPGTETMVLHQLVAIAGAFTQHGQQQCFHVAIEGFLGELHNLMVYSLTA